MTTTPAEVSSSEARERQGLMHVDQAPNYYRWLANKFAGVVKGRIVEHGSGTGALSRALLARGVEPLTCVEPDEGLLPELKTNIAGHSRATIFKGTMSDYLAAHGKGSADGIVSSNVLEHIEDDIGCLKTMHDVLTPGGTVALYVPARQEVYGPFDEAVGHFRRYDKEDLAAKLEKAGFVVSAISYRNLLGLAGWYVSQRSFRTNHVGSFSVKLYDKVVFPLGRIVEDRVAPPVGLNLWAVGTKVR